jgi:small subunit ribosomal protein S16|tara:strand:- start:90 stop:341 length:252 start_codon:yes stop_codon:yes gene_type:complete
LAVVIRLSRRGAKKRPFYRVVAADKRSPRDGKFLEVLGTFDPLKEEGGLKMNPERIQSWMKNGAKPSDTVAALIKKAGIASES